MNDKRDKLNDASNNVQNQYEKAAKLKQQQQQGSEMVRRDQPSMHLTPNGSMREAADRQSYNDRLACERAAAQRNADINAKKQEQQKQQELETQKGKDDKDRSR